MKIVPARFKYRIKKGRGKAAQSKLILLDQPDKEEPLRTLTEVNHH